MIDYSDPVVQIIFAINNQLRNRCLQYLELDPIGFSFMQGIGTNPPHIHVECEDKIAKCWLNPVRLHRSGGFSRVEIGQILKIINQHHQRFMEAWHEYFGK
jgi:hypothetical protein